MSTFEPLIKIGTTAFPYWLIAAVLLSLVAAFVAKRRNQQPFFATAIAQMACTCVVLFMILGLYAQLTGPAMSFVELLPASLIVALGFSAATVIWVRSMEKLGLGMTTLIFALPSVVFTLFLAFVVSFFPKLMHFQFNLLRSVWRVL